MKYMKNIRVMTLVTVLLLVLAGTRASANKPIIYVVDLRYTESLSKPECYDIRHSAVCVQGLVNRESPRVFLTLSDADAKWLDRIREPGGLCEGWEVRYLTFQQLFTFFRHYIRGVIFYDPDPSTGTISTSLVATSAAGVENAIALRKDASSSTYGYLINTLKLPVIIDLSGKFTGTGTIWGTSTPSTGSAKCDAYIWAKEKYIDTGKCNPTVLMYTLDLIGIEQDSRAFSQLANLDYGVSQKGFCFELSPWGDEEPSDDLYQPLGTDLNTFKTILNACNQQTGKGKMIKVCGFPNWYVKYTNYANVGGTHTPVATEWQIVSLCSAYNAYMEADAPSPNNVDNASFYAGLLPAFESRHYVQNPPPTYNDMVARGLIDSSGNVVNGNYLALYLCDYDQASWVLYVLANNGGVYDDPTKQYVYCNWGVDPNAMDRVCVAVDYMYRHKTSKDFFVGWDSGAGYVNPTQLYGTRDPSGYPSGVDLWQKHCTKYYRALDYSITGWVFDGAYTTTTTDCSNYARFSGDGLGVWSSISFSNPMLQNNVPLSKASNSIIDYSSGVHFSWYRMNAQKSPTYLKSITDSYASSGHNHQFLDAYTYYYLLRYYLGGSNNYREAWVNENTPRIMQCGQKYTVNVTVRNDGWDTWSSADAYRLAYAIVNQNVTPVSSDYDSRGRFMIPSGVSVAPGQSTTFTVSVIAPSTPGTYDLYYDMVQDGHTWFSAKNNLECKKTVIVANDPMSIDTDGDGTPDVVEQAGGDLYWHAGDNYALGPTLPSMPTDIGAFTNSTSIRFNWSAASDSRFNVVGYYCRVGTTPGGNDVFDGYVDNVCYKLISGCVNGRTYYCSVQAVNDAGYVGSWCTSDGITVDTGMPGTPGIPVDEGLVTGSQSVTFKWTPATDTLSGINSYNCRIGTYSGGSDVFSGNVGNVLTKTISVNYGSRYYCSVQAKDNAGNVGSWSISSDGILVMKDAGAGINYVKTLQDSSAVGLIAKKVTAIFGDCIYVEEPDRSSGIRVIVPSLPANITLGSAVDIIGSVYTNAGQRYVSASAIQISME